MEKRNRNIMILSIVALVLVLVGVTYAYFSAGITGLESASTISMTAGRMEIIYSEGDENISADNIYPREEAWITKTITLTGYNSTNLEMKYNLGIDIENNTFKAGELTLELTGEGNNGTKIDDIEKKEIVGTNRFLKIGQGTFVNSNGNTHVYTLKIYFKDTGRTQNYNQGAIFNGKITIKEVSENKKVITNITPNDCTYEGELTAGATYTDGQYTYKYKQKGNQYAAWNSIDIDGWGIMLTDSDSNNGSSTNAVTSPTCTSINGKPIVATSYMFKNSNASSIDLSIFDTSNITDMEVMFYKTKTTSIDLSKLDTSSVTTMFQMFEESYFESLNLETFDTSNVTTMTGMFSGSILPSINLEFFDTSNVTIMYIMFLNSQATVINLSSFDTSNVTRMDYMFYSSNNLKTIYASDKFVTTKLNTTNSHKYMFTGATKLVGGAGTTYSSSYVDKTRAHIDGGTSNPGYFTRK